MTADTARQITEARQAAGFRTREDAARWLGVKLPTFIKWERGEAAPPAYALPWLLEKLAQRASEQEHRP